MDEETMKMKENFDSRIKELEKKVVELKKIADSLSNTYEPRHIRFA